MSKDNFTLIIGIILLTDVLSSVVGYSDENNYFLFGIQTSFFFSISVRVIVIVLCFFNFFNRKKAK